MMNSKELIEIINQLKEYERLQKEVAEIVDGLKDALKMEMVERDCEELAVEDSNYIIRYTAVLSNRFDSTAFKKVMPDVYKAYTKSVQTKRFTISA